MKKLMKIICCVVVGVLMFGGCTKRRQESQPSTENLSAGMKALLKKAEAGDPVYQDSLATCYFYGNGVEKDYSLAVYWFKKAAEQGYAEAQYGLAGRYLYGQGIVQNYDEALKWARKSAEQGYNRGYFRLGKLYEYGWGVKKDLSEAYKN